MRHIKFTTYGSSPIVGGFAPGDSARIDDDMARHFVDDAKCACYADVETSVQPDGGVVSDVAGKAPAKRAPRKAGGQQA